LFLASYDLDGFRAFAATERFREVFGLPEAEYDDLAECTLAVLRAQVDHEKQRRGVASGDTAGDLRDPDDTQ
jgi:hypothetical protein